MHEPLIILAQVANPFPHVAANQSTLRILLNILFGVAGALAILFIVLGGFRYVISDGDAQEAARARNTIIYAAVGLLLIVMAAAIVNFVVGKL